MRCDAHQLVVGGVVHDAGAHNHGGELVEVGLIDKLLGAAGRRARGRRVVPRVHLVHGPTQQALLLVPL
jgi:hypothetical protein